jgi:hypothetical protein
LGGTVVFFDCYKYTYGPQLKELGHPSFVRASPEGGRCAGEMLERIIDE